VALIVRIPLALGMIGLIWVIEFALVDAAFDAMLVR
jgi:hypothetical protein